MNIHGLAEELDKIIPLSLREEWDNDGIMVSPDAGREVKKVIIALDATSSAIDCAKSVGADAIVTHHPLIFKGLSSLDCADSVGKRVIECVKSGIAVLSYHTRLDSVAGGVNDCLAEVLGIKNTSDFLPFGRFGELDYEMDFASFVIHCEKSLGEKAISMVNAGKRIKKVAVVSGGGKDFVRDAYLAGADAYVTGEASHSALIEAEEYGINMLCLTHHATERVVLPALGELVKKASGNSVETIIFDFDRVREYGI